MADKLSGVAASDGIAHAKSYLFVEPDLNFSKEAVNHADQEIERLNQAIDQSIQDLSDIKSNAIENLGAEEAQIFDAHMMVLSDPELIEQTKNFINEHLINAEYAFDQTTSHFIKTFEAMDDNEYMQERAADIKDVRKRVLAHLLGVTLPDPSTIKEEVIVVAEDLTPSDTAQLDKKYVKAFVTDIGGRTSHSAIMARSLEIPAVVGTKRVTELVAHGQELIVDGLNGEVLISPSESEVDEYMEKSKAFIDQQLEWAKLKEEKTLTKDNHHVELAANIGSPKDLPGVLYNGAEGVGLYRTEFLYMNSSHLPSEEEQYQAYKEVLEKLENKPVVVRTMDIGGDKELSYLQLPHEMNPFLGYRAIRISLDQDEIFRTQLRALLRASVYGTLRIMFPMIATIKELNEAKDIYHQEKEKLIQAGVEIADNIQIGIMIEIPAAAMLADQFAKEVDFFSIGTNDLIQYTMAADRMNERVSYLYQPYNPSILRLIDRVIQAAHQVGRWVGMCGEMAGDQTAVPLLLGLGLDEFSMSAPSILKTRTLLKKLDTNQMKQLAQTALNHCQTSEEVVDLVKNIELN